MKTEWTVKSLIEAEDEIARRFDAGEFPVPVHLSGGNERELLKIFELIREEDYIFASHRNHYAYLLKGGSLQEIIDELGRKPSAICGGQAGSMNLTNPSIRFWGNAVLGGHAAVAAGVALGLKKQGSSARVWCFLGDGASDNGHIIEAIRFCAFRDLPIRFVIEDNDFSVDSSTKDRWKNYKPIEASNVIRYSYTRTRPHVGTGKWVTF